MEKFKAHVLSMEANFDGSWGSNSVLNNFFYNYEKNVLSGHLISLHHQNRASGVRRAGSVGGGPQSSNHRNNFLIGHSVSDLQNDTTQYILFEHENKKHLKE